MDTKTPSKKFDQLTGEINRNFYKKERKMGRKKKDMERLNFAGYSGKSYLRLKAGRGRNTYFPARGYRSTYDLLSLQFLR